MEKEWQKIRSDFLESPTCVVCGKLADVVHHLDKDQSNNDLINLVALCSGCHTGYHGQYYPFYHKKRREGIIKILDGIAEFRGLLNPDERMQKRKELLKIREKLREILRENDTKLGLTSKRLANLSKIDFKKVASYVRHDSKVMNLSNPDGKISYPSIAPKARWRLKELLNQESNC